MNLMFSPLPLPETPQFQPNKLIELARNLGCSGNFTSLEKLKNLPVAQARNIDEILTDIQHGRANKVSRLEWVYCTQNKAVWDKENPDKSRATAEAIWNLAVRDSWLSRILLWRLTLYHSGQLEEVLAPTLANCFSIFEAHSNNSRLLPVRIIKALTQGRSAYDVATIAREHLLTPKELLNNAKLPQGIPVVGRTLKSIVSQFTKLQPPSKQQVEWLLRCLDEMSLEQQVSAVNDLLTQVSTKVGGSFPKLVAWLRKHYSPRGTGERWHQLSEQAKRALRDWIGAVNYGDFANLVDRLLQVLRIEDWEQNQLHSTLR